MEESLTMLLDIAKVIKSDPEIDLDDEAIITSMSGGVPEAS